MLGVHHVLLIMDRPYSPSDDNTLTLQHSGTEPGVQTLDVPSDILDHRKRGHQVQEGGGGATDTDSLIKQHTV